MDDDSLLKTVMNILEKQGYHSEGAKDGKEAIQMYRKARESGKSFDGVILDLTVSGGMGGKEAVKKLLEMDSEAKCIVSSGYSDDPVMSNFQEYGFKGVLPKPYRSISLGRVLNEELNGG